MEFPIDKFIIKKEITSSDIKAASSLDLTVPGSGEIKIDDIILKTDGTGLAGGTNIEITTDNDNGAENVMVETVANLGANATVELSGASVSGVKTVLEDGKRLQMNCTGVDCTGAGKVFVYIFCSRATKSAQIY